LVASVRTLNGRARRIDREHFKTDNLAIHSLEQSWDVIKL